jgi:acyl dehydratase
MRSMPSSPATLASSSALDLDLASEEHLWDFIVPKVGEPIGTSRWFVMKPERILQYADVVEDWQCIHVDEGSAQNMGLNTIIAHGYLTMSLVSAMMFDISPFDDERFILINYGIDKARFVKPVEAGKNVRGVFHLKEATVREDGKLLIRYGVSVEIENDTKPALVMDWLLLVQKRLPHQIKMTKARVPA